MRINKVTQKYISIVCLIIIAHGLTNKAKSSNKTPTIKFQSLPIYLGFNVTRVDTVGKAIDFKNWPQTETRRVGLVINKSLISYPNMVTQESTSYSHIQFVQTTCGRFEWSCQRHVKTNIPIPADFPPKRKAWLLEHLPSKKRNDPNFLQEYLKRKLERYRRSKGYHREGSMLVQICLAPISRAAQEYMLVIMTENTLPVEGVISMYTHAKRPKGLGTVSFLTESTKKDDIRIKFVRDNVFLSIRGNGCFADEVLPLARKIDTLLVKQPPLTYQQLLGRRPEVTIATKPEKTRAKGQWMVSFDTSAPAGQEIVDVKSYVDGQLSWIEDKKVVITNKQKGQVVKVKVVATTGELLTNTYEKEVIVPK